MRNILYTYYGRICRAVFVTLLLLCVSGKASAQIAEGFYYIASYSNYSKNNHAASYYICPATIEWASGQPYLSTNQTNQGDMFELIKEGDYFYIKHVSSGKYLTINGPTFASGNVHRRRVHLEEVETPGEDNLFSIIN